MEKTSEADYNEKSPNQNNSTFRRSNIFIAVTHIGFPVVVLDVINLLL